MLYETVVERMKTVPPMALEEIYSYIESVCNKYSMATTNAAEGLAFIKKYSGKIDRDIDCKAELLQTLDEKYENIT